MTPIVDGKVHHFEFGGIYDGLALLRDRETGSIWNHITGECVYGPLTGKKLSTFNLLHTNVSQALAINTEIKVAISDAKLKPNRRSPHKKKGGKLSSKFRGTIDQEDTRRPPMEVGLGIWSDSTSRYYPLEEIQNLGNAIIDKFAGRNLLIYIEPLNSTPSALFIDAAGFSWQGDNLYLSSGDFMSKGRLFSDVGEKLEIERPMQLFTRWYGFALTFPKCGIYEKHKNL